MMSALTRTISVWLITHFLVYSKSEGGDPQQIEVKSGEDATLQCYGPKNADIIEIKIKWKKTDLKSEDYVFFFRENRAYEDEQHESFRGRVKLKDPEMKDGDVSVILQNVNINDAGTYECHVGIKKGSSELINTITLTVSDSGHDQLGGDKDGQTEGGDNKEKGNTVGLVVGLLVAAVLLVVVVGFVIYKKRRDQNSHQQPSRQIHELEPL